VAARVRSWFNKPHVCWLWELDKPNVGGGMMPMATATAVKPHDPSAKTSTIRRALSSRKASRPRRVGDGVVEQAVGGSVGRRRTTWVVDVDVRWARRLRICDGGDGG
jgi:hypothetical protein